VSSLLCAPLIDEKGEPFGTITFLHGVSTRQYRDDDVPIAEELARRAAAAFRHAEHFQRERATAETLQRSLLPQRVPALRGVGTAARYLPGGESERVGGDWYDVFELPDRSVLFAIGDVVGHGLHAASSAGLLRSAAQLAALDRLEPAMILEQLNRWLLALPDADMATVTVALYTPHTRVLRYASAGHPPVVRVRHGKSTFLRGALAPPLRASASSEFRERRVRLNVDDLLLFYTDGLIERRGEPIDEGLERLRATVADPHDDLERLADDVLAKMLPPAGPADDVALLAVRIRAADTLDEEIAAGEPPPRRRARAWFRRRSERRREA
jgi:serine phosphatase RsbU (regulator of sigma subunit)